MVKDFASGTLGAGAGAGAGVGVDVEALGGDADAATVDRLTRTMLALRRNGSWGCACQNAAALDALVDIAAAAGPPPNLNATATVASATVATVAFTDHRAAAQTTNVAAARLPRGQSTIALTLASQGPLHYAVTYRYRLAGEQRGQLNGLRITRIVHPAGTATSAATMGLAMLAQPVDLHAAQVFDIELQVITDHPIDRVQITDPLPAGMEAVDTSFKTNTTTAPAESWQIDDQQIFHDRIEAYADHLGPGIEIRPMHVDEQIRTREDRFARPERRHRHEAAPFELDTQAAVENHGENPIRTPTAIESSAAEPRFDVSDLAFERRQDALPRVTRRRLSAVRA